MVLTPQIAMEIYSCKMEIEALMKDHSCRAPLQGQSSYIANRFNVSAKTIRDIWSRRTWTFATSSLWRTDISGQAEHAAYSTVRRNDVFGFFPGNSLRAHQILDGCILRQQLSRLHETNYFSNSVDSPAETVQSKNIIQSIIRVQPNSQSHTAVNRNPLGGFTQHPPGCAPVVSLWNEAVFTPPFGRCPSPPPPCGGHAACIDGADDPFAAEQLVDSFFEDWPAWTDANMQP
jgi:hypothetical protein